ncbi:MAG: hypothetical protein K0S38_1088 [Candidatus Paceibacter sp.]|jgi:hypothetical protein|nr:hypothetical protein [Candidatus Paceibacter sp.]
MRKKKKILATGTVVTTLLLAGASVTFAQSAPAPTHSKSSFRAPHARPLLDDIAVDLGLDPEIIREELKTGKTPKEVLEEQGVSPSQIQKLFKDKEIPVGKKGIRRDMSADMLNTLSNALGISVSQLKQAFTSGKKPEEIALDEGLTKEQFHQNLVTELQILLNKGTLSTSESNYYKKMIQRLQNT